MGTITSSEMTQAIPSQYISGLGRRLLETVQGTGRFCIFCGDSLRRIVFAPPRLTHTSGQMVAIGLDSLPIANLTALFVGMVMVLQTGYQLALFGVRGWSAGITAIALAREMVPVFTGIVVGAKVAASIAAELGTMKVTEQLDAMEVAGVNPVSQLVVPRVIGTVLMLPLISIYSLVIGFVGSVLVGNYALHIPPRQFYESSLSWLSLSDLYTGLAKAFVFGLIIALVGCYHGCHARGGAAGVGRATPSAVVCSLAAILVTNYVLSTWFLHLLNQL